MGSEESKPYVRGLSLRIETGGADGPFTKTYSILPFSCKAQAIGRLLAANGVLKPNELFNYFISAFPLDNGRASGAPERGSRLKAKVTHLRKAALEARPADLFGEEAPVSGELFDVYVERAVLGEILRQAKEARQNERACFLIGYPGRDPETGRTFVAVTDQTPADRGVEATCTSFTFSDETFAAAHERLARRRTAMSLSWGGAQPHLLSRVSETFAVFGQHGFLVAGR